jgi:hypothetical protein
MSSRSDYWPILFAHKNNGALRNIFMQINWCLKGIAESASFNDAEASAVLSSTGILSKWMLANAAQTSQQANIDSQKALNASALDDHVNNYAKVVKDTPYISLSSGCIEYAGATLPPIRHPALRTALKFATNSGRQFGYVFRCWVKTGVKPAAELPGLAEEIRDLNLFADFYAYHRQGEVTAKLIVPRRQVEWVIKFGPDLKPARAPWTRPGRHHLKNSDFVGPDRVSNVIEEIS